LKENDKALEDFEKAIDLNGRDPNILYNRGNVFLNMAQFD